MKSITATSSREFYQAYCPQVKRIILTEQEVEVLFSDDSVVKTKLHPIEWKRSVLEAIIKRTYGIVFSDGTVECNGFDENLEALYSLAEADSKLSPKISKTASPVRKTSKIASLLNSSGDLFNPAPHPSKSLEYIRPNKPFKEFTPSEKRAYWRAANMRRKSKIS